MKENWMNKIPTYLIELAKSGHSTAALSPCFALAIISSLVNRKLYEAFPVMSLAIKITDDVVLVAGALAGLFAAAVVSFRILRKRHAMFGVISFVVLIAAARFAMHHLRAAGVEPISGPPLFGGVIVAVVFGWLFGFLMSLIDRHS